MPSYRKQFTPEQLKNIFTPLITERYFRVFRRCPDLTTPSRFTEKLQWIKLNSDPFDLSRIADKASLGQYLAARLGKDIGFPVKDIVEPAEVGTLVPSPGTILKCSHGSSMNVVPSDPPDPARILRTLTRYLSTDYSMQYFEPWYHYITPVVLVEPLLDDLQEIKVWCFNGEVCFYELFKLLGRGEMSISYYDMDWKYMDWLVRKRFACNVVHDAPRPSRLDEIRDIAACLCKGFPFIRVDFAMSGNNLYCSELTFTPTAGFQTYIGDGDLRLGALLQLPS